MAITLLNDEMTSPSGKGPYFSNPDWTSRVFGKSTAALCAELLEAMIQFESKEMFTPPRSLEDARQLTDFHNHPDVVEEWEGSSQNGDDYEGPEWFYGALASFAFSFKALYGTFKFLKGYRPDFDPKVIVDWGAGLGMHSLISTILWPNAKVYYYNLPGLQTEFAKKWVKKEFEADRMIIKTKRESLPEKADMILSYEFLEHMKDPVAATKDTLSLKPEIVSVSFSFTAPCHGHFTYFDTPEGEVHRSEVTRYVNNEFRRKYTAIGHGWNARPVIWERTKR